MKKILIGILIVLILAASGFVIWAESASAPMPEALSAMQSNAQVQVTTDPWIVFRPVSGEKSTGLIFYPGGRVDPRSYAPMGQAIAAQGYPVVIVPMPLNLAVVAPGKAAEVIQAFPEISNWVISGHSLGGSMAANFAAKNPGKVQGLAFWASYPASSDNLSSLPIRTVSIYGTKDGLATPAKVQASRPLLPPDTQWVAIEGGNHAQFGWYGPQAGDQPATISREKQQGLAINATLNLLKQLETSQQ